MKMLLFGGTSFFGRSIARYFRDAGYGVTLFTRGNVRPPDLRGISHVPGDRSRKEDLLNLLTAGPWDVVIDNIGYDGMSTAQLLGVLGEVGHYIFCSTVSVYRYVRDRYPQPLQESATDPDFRPTVEDLKNPHWSYARGKLEAERIVRQQRGLPWTILRPSVVYGPYVVTARGFWYLARILRGGPLLLADGGCASFRLSYSEDVARSFLEVAGHRSATVGKIYNVAQSEILTLRDFVEESVAALGKKADVVSVPLEVLGDWAGPYGGMVNLVQDTTAAARDFGHVPTPWEIFAETTAKWFVDSWHGNWDKMLKTRNHELEFAVRWRAATTTFPARSLA